jgi:phenylacetate-CoA ligase
MYLPQAAYLPANEIQAIQQNKLQQLVQYVAAHSPYYKELFATHNINAVNIKTLDDLKKIPTTNKEHLQQRNNDFLCVPQNKIIEYSSTSGTLGSPVTIALTDNDLNRLAYNEYASFTCADGTVNDIFQLMLTLDRQFMAGMAYYSGIRKMGAGIIRLGPGVPSLQWETILRLKPTAIVAVPSFIIKLIQFAKEHGIDINSTSVKKAICIGENIRNTNFSINILGKKITDAWHIKLYSTYASTEMQTAFTVEGMPLLRYKTGDICIQHTSTCTCGRTSTRLSPIVGRKKQMIKYKGTTLYPPALFDILNEMEDVLDYVAEVYSNEMGTDEVLLHILPLNLTEECDRKLRANLQARLRVSPHVKYSTAEQLVKMQMPEAGRKLIRFIDNRI